MIEKLLLVVCAFSFSAFCLFFLKKENGKVLLEIDNCFILFMLVVSGIVFPFDYFYSIGMNAGTNDAFVILASYSVDEMILYYLCVLSFMIPFIIAFRFVAKRSNSTFRIEVQQDNNAKITLSIAVALLLIGIVSDRLYLNAYGSYTNYLAESNFIRSGVSHFTNKWSFLIVFRECVVLSSYLLFASITRRTGFYPIKFLLFILSFGYSFWVLYSNRGRLSMILFLMSFPVLFFLLKRRPRFLSGKTVLLCFAVTGLFAVLLRWAGALLMRNSDSGMVSSLVSESSFPFTNFKLLVSKSDEYSKRLFVDIVSYPIYLLPSSIWGKIIPKTASDICTILFLGGVKGTNGIYGEMPCDLISLGFLQFGILGELAIGILFGLLIGLLFVKVRKWANATLRITISTYLCIYLVLHSVFYCDPYLVVKKMFPGILLFFIIKSASLLGFRLLQNDEYEKQPME